MHCPEWHDSILSRFDAEQIVSTIARSGAKGMVAFAKDCYGNAYYDTKYGHKHRCIGKRDLLAETLSAGAKHGIAVDAYYCTIWDNHAAEDHPEWRMRGPDGRDLYDAVTNGGESRWRYLCHNSGFADLAVKMVDEIASNYDVAGFHLDMFNMEFKGLSCYCQACQDLFRHDAGRELPRVAEWDDTWRQFLEFRYRSVERYMRRLREAIHRHRPGLPVVMNFHASPNFDWRVGQMPVRHSLPSDVATGETYTPMFGDLYPGMETRYLKGLCGQRQVELVSWRMNRITDFTTKPREQLRWELFSSLALGARVMLIDQPFADGWLDEYPYEQIGRIFAEIKSKQPFLGGETQKHVGIYFSCKNRDFYGRDHQAAFLQPVIGAYKALVESHIETGFIFDELVDDRILAEYPVVFLPNVAIINEREAGLFQTYVENGGTLIASYDTSLYSQDGKKRSDFLLGGLFGVKYEGTLESDVVFLRGLGDPYGRGIAPKCYVLVEGTSHRCRPTTARGLGDLHKAFFTKRFPDRFFSHSVHPPCRRETDALYVNKVGRGTVIYLPHACDAAYAGLHELPEHRLLIGNIIRSAGHVPPVEIDAPLNVESTVARKDNMLLVNLLAFNPVRQAVTLPSLDRPIRPSFRMEQPPLYTARLHVRVPFNKVRAFGSGTRLESRQNVIELTCEDVHEVVIIEL